MGSIRRLIALAAAVVMGMTPKASAQQVPQEMLKPENRTVSVTKQFTAFGGTKKDRSALVRRAEDLKTGVLREMQMRDAWKWPVLIMLMPGDGARLRQAPILVQVVDAGDAGRKVQVDISPNGLADPEGLDFGILRGIFAELAVRDQKVVKGKFVDAPAWIIAAIKANMDREARGQDVEIFNSLLEGGKLPKFEKFLTQNPEGLKGQARELYAAQSLAMFQGLVDLGGGRQKIANNLMLSDPAKDPMERFGQTWSEIQKDTDKLARVWALGVAKLAAPRRTELLSAADTGTRLSAEIEKLEKNEEGIEPTKHILDLSKTPEGRFRLDATATELRRLGFRAHPLYAALVEEYRMMIEDLFHKRRKKFVPKFEEAEELRLALDARVTEITAFLDDFQENASDTIIQPATRRSWKLPEKSPKRNDAISRYLDGIEQRGW